jgi:hypothetical protein
VRWNDQPRNNDEQRHPYELWIAGGSRRSAMMSNAEAADLCDALERALGDGAILAGQHETLVDEALVRAAALVPQVRFVGPFNADAFHAWWRGYYDGQGDLSAATALRAVRSVWPELASLPVDAVLRRFAEAERDYLTHDELARWAVFLAARAVLADVRSHDAEPGAPPESPEHAHLLAEAALRGVERAQDARRRAQTDA